MLYEFLSENRDELITRCKAKVAKRPALHGGELLRRGLTVDQVVHDYGDLCRAVTELAIEEDAAVTVAEFRTLNRCLDDRSGLGLGLSISKSRDRSKRGKALRAQSPRQGLHFHD
ncbi:MAG: hypothetical protein ACXWCS_12030 [Burkholderiales bacterium]